MPDTYVSDLNLSVRVHLAAWHTRVGGAFQLTLFLYRKSQLAIEYCYRFCERSPEASVFWLHGSSDRFLQAYREIT